MKGSECKFVKYMEGSDKRFVIPVYQRNYDWKTENCKQLYDDLIKIVKNGRKSHFFGSLVSVYNPDGSNEEFLVIDGQQRLTTVSLLFLAMYNLMNNGVVVAKASNLKQRIYEEYLVDKWQPEETRIKLKPVKNDQKAYKLLSREFDLPEIKLIIDAIQASKSIPESMTRTLIGKIEMLCSEYQAKELNRDVIVSGRVKTINEGAQNNIDYIHTAISNDQQITCKYFDYDTSLKKKYRKRGSQYTLSPFALVYSDENYYLLAYDAQLKEIRNYRVDRMENVSCVEGSVRDGKKEFAAIDMEKYKQYTFGMYGGEVKEVTMVFTNNMVNAVVDRFGRDIMIHKEDGYHFRVSVPVAVSPQFYGWVFGLGKMVRIVGPEDVRQGYLEMMKDVREKYE